MYPRSWKPLVHNLLSVDVGMDTLNHFCAYVHQAFSASACLISSHVCLLSPPQPTCICSQQPHHTVGPRWGPLMGTSRSPSAQCLCSYRGLHQCVSSCLHSIATPLGHGISCSKNVLPSGCTASVLGFTSCLPSESVT